MRPFCVLFANSLRLSLRLSREYCSLSDVEARISIAESELNESSELLSEAISGLHGTVSLIKRRNSKVSDTQSELVILRRIRASLRNDSSEASSPPAYGIFGISRRHQYRKVASQLSGD